MEIFTIFDAKLKPIWDEAFQATRPNYPFYTYEWHSRWSQTLGQGCPLLIYHHQHALLPLFKDGPVARFTGGDEIADYLDILGPKADAHPLLTQVLKDLPAHGITSLNLTNIPQGSTLLSHLTNKTTITQEDTTPLLTLPQTWDDYLASLKRKLRKEIKRKLKRFNEAYPQVTFIADDQVNLDAATIFTLMSKNPDKTTFLTPVMKQFFQKVITMPPARTVRLVNGDTTIAFKLFFQDQDTIYLYNSGYDPSFDMAGVVLVTNHIQHAISQKVKTYNFLQGSERYKYDFGAQDFPVYHLKLKVNQ